MPLIGEIKKGREIGRTSRQSHIWQACGGCGKQRWVQLRKGQPKSLQCHSCSLLGDKCYLWKGGRLKTFHGYIEIRLYPDDFFYSMATKSKGYVLEHRLVMARNLGRCLHQWELVHHKNHIRNDNRIENLQLISDGRHKQITLLEKRITYLENRVTLLEAENVFLTRGTKSNGTTRILL